MTTLIHLSDLHFGALDPAVTDRLAGYLAALPSDLVVVSGDLTQRSRPGQFRACNEFLARLGKPVLAVPGNHDIPLYAFWERLICPQRRYRRYAAGRYLRTWSNDEVCVIGMNSSRPFVPVWRGFWKDGRLGNADWNELSAEIARCPGRLAVAVIHHPLLPAPVPVHGVLLDRHSAAHRLAGLGVRVVLSGHLHVAYADPAESEGRLLCVQAGTATSRRRRHGSHGEELANSFQRLVVEGQRLRVETHAWGESGWAVAGVRDAQWQGETWVWTR